MSEKSILEQALLQVNTLEEAVKQNAKGILSSVMKQELNDLLKESQMEEEDEVKNEEVSEDVSEEKSQPKEEEKDMSEQPEEDDDDESDDDSESEDEVEPENTDDLDNEDPVKGLDNLDSEMGDDDSPSLEPSLDDEMSDDDVMDMTGASDDEVLKVFKAMKPEDGIVVKKDGNNVELETGDDEFIIKLDEEEESKEEVGEEKSEPEESVAEETLYEIELDEEEESKEKEAKEEAKEEESKEVKEVEATEAVRTKWNPHGNKGEADRAGLPSKKVFKAGSGLNEEVDTLKKQNAEYKKALVLFKEKLNEVAVFNASLAYATRLFTEHTTTKQEKLNILKRFDSISNMNESKNLFNTIKTELENRTPISESVVDKISTSPSSSATEVLSESKAYENPQFRRMKDLMAKIK
jgi:hypothetical protein